MKALRFEKTGSLDGLTIETIPEPVSTDGEVLVRVKAAAVHPSDVKNVLGRMHVTSPAESGSYTLNQSLRPRE